MTPLEYVHALRLEEAKQILETEFDLPIEAGANEVGYEDAGFFSRLFRREINLTPSQYRKRFGGLRKSLSPMNECEWKWNSKFSPSTMIWLFEG